MKWYVLTGLAVAGTAVIAGLGYYILKPRRNEDSQDPQSRFTGEETPPETPGQNIPRYLAPVTPAPVVNSGFPLKKGSRGEYVRNLQNALINKYGATILPKYGADGSWGNEMETALTSKGLKTSIDNTLYTDYITGNFSSSASTTNSSAPKTTASSLSNDIKNLIMPSSIVDPKVAIGYKIFTASKSKDLNSVLALLGELKSVTDYTSASQGFQLRPWTVTYKLNWLGIPTPDITRYTLVNGLLTAFTNAADKTKLRAEFTRIGLKETVKNSSPDNYDSTWSLSGLGNAHRNIRTVMRAVISDGFNIRVEVPARTLLGQWLSSGNGYTRFRSLDGRDLYVRTNAIVFA